MTISMWSLFVTLLAYFLHTYFFLNELQNREAGTILSATSRKVWKCMFTRIVRSHSYHVSLTVALCFTCLVMLLLQPKDWFRDWPQTIGRQGGAAHPGLHDAHQHLHTGDWELDFTSPYLPLTACCITGSGSNSSIQLQGEYLHLSLFPWWRKYSQAPAGGWGLPAIRNVLKWSDCENKILQICHFHHPQI